MYFFLRQLFKIPVYSDTSNQSVPQVIASENSQNFTGIQRKDLMFPLALICGVLTCLFSLVRLESNFIKSWFLLSPAPFAACNLWALGWLILLSGL